MVKVSSFFSGQVQCTWWMRSRTVTPLRMVPVVECGRARWLVLFRKGVSQRMPWVRVVWLLQMMSSWRQTVGELCYFDMASHPNTVDLLLSHAGVFPGLYDRVNVLRYPSTYRRFYLICLLGWFLELIKEFVYVSKQLNENSVIRYLIVDMSLNFPESRFYYVICHFSLSMPCLCIYFHLFSWPWYRFKCLSFLDLFEHNRNGCVAQKYRISATHARHMHTLIHLCSIIKPTIHLNTFMWIWIVIQTSIKSYLRLPFVVYLITALPSTFLLFILFYLGCAMLIMGFVISVCVGYLVHCRLCAIRKRTAQFLRRIRLFKCVHPQSFVSMCTYYQSIIKTTQDLNETLSFMYGYSIIFGSFFVVFQSVILYFRTLRPETIFMFNHTTFNVLICSTIMPSFLSGAIQRQVSLEICMLFICST